MTAISVPVPPSPIGTVDPDTGQIVMAREWYRFFGLLQQGVGGDTGTLTDAADSVFIQTIAHSDIDTLRRRVDELSTRAGLRVSVDTDALRRKVNDLEKAIASTRPYPPATVSSVFGRSGAVVAKSGDYSAAQLSDTVAPTSFTPVLKIGGATTGITYGNQLGTYHQLDKLVAFSITIDLTSKGSATGSLTVSIPVATGNFVNGRPLLIAAVSGAYTGQVYGITTESSSLITININNGGTLSVMADTNITDTSSIYLSGSYISA